MHKHTQKTITAMENYGKTCCFTTQGLDALQTWTWIVSRTLPGGCQNSR